MKFTKEDIRALFTKASEAEEFATRIRPDQRSWTVATADGFWVLRRVDKVRLMPFRPDVKGIVATSEDKAREAARTLNDADPGRKVVATPICRLSLLNARRWRDTASKLASFAEAA